MTMTEPAARAPLGIGGLMTGTFGLFFRRFLLFFAIAIVPSLIMNVLSYAMIGNTIEAQATGEVLPPDQIFGAGYFIFLILSLLIGLVVFGVTTLAAYDALLGEPIRIGVYVSRTLKALPAIVVLGLLFYLMMVVGLVLLILPGLYLIARFYVFTPAILVEGAGFGALGRASELSKGYRWPIVGALILIGIVIILLSAVSQLFVGLVLAGTGGLLLFFVLQSVLSAVIYAISSIFAALLYARLREIKEGLGLRDLASVFE